VTSYQLWRNCGKGLMEIIDITHLPQSGVYLFFWKSELQYVGESRRGAARVEEHEGKWPWDRRWFVPCSGNRKMVEQHLIHDLRPRYNKAMNQPRNGSVRRAPPAKFREAREYIEKLDVRTKDKVEKPTLVRLGIRKPEAKPDLIKALGLRTYMEPAPHLRERTEPTGPVRRL
jgi:hypothetical protein